MFELVKSAVHTWRNEQRTGVKIEKRLEGVEGGVGGTTSGL